MIKIVENSYKYKSCDVFAKVTRLGKNHLFEYVAALLCTSIDPKKV